jgi:hypothetical protein
MRVFGLPKWDSREGGNPIFNFYTLATSSL